MKWTELSKRDIYENSWIKVSEHEVITPNGYNGLYGKVHYKNTTVGIVPILEGNKTVLIGQERFPTQSYSWEIPLGGAEVGESHLDAAKRELKEEAGLIADEWIKLLNLETSNSVSDEEAVVYYCKGITIENRIPEETELLRLKFIDFNEVFNMVMRGDIKDAISIAAILKMYLVINKNKQ